MPRKILNKNSGYAITITPFWLLLSFKKCASQLNDKNNPT